MFFQVLFPGVLKENKRTLKNNGRPPLGPPRAHDVNPASSPCSWALAFQGGCSRDLASTAVNSPSGQLTPQTTHPAFALLGAQPSLFSIYFFVGF